MTVAPQQHVSHQLFSFLILFLSAGAVAAPGPLEVLRVTPSGDDVPPGNQIVIEFDRPMVPLGRMDRDASEIPVTVAPALDCQWRWVNRQALACNLEEAGKMSWSTRYTIGVSPGFEAMDGSRLEDALAVEFTTSRPAVTTASVKEWTRPGVPVVRLTFNQPVFGSSVEEVFEWSVESESRPFGVAVRPDPDVNRMIVDEVTPDVGDAEDLHRLWLVEPAGPLPLDREVILDHRDGLRSPLGTERGLERSGVIGFHTFPEFRFLGVRCNNNAGQSIVIAPEEREVTDPAWMCDPLSFVQLQFSTPVLTSEVVRTLVIEPDLAGGRDDYDPWANAYDYYARLGFAHRQERTYGVSIPERLRAYQPYRITQRHQDLGVVDTVRAWFGGSTEADTKDVFGRPLENPVDFEFWTNHRRPDFRLVHRDGVLESAIDSEVPLYVTNLEQVRLGYRRLGPDGATSVIARTIEIPDAEDVSFAVPLQVRDMADGGAGAVYGTIRSTPEVSKPPRARRFFAQVTPYQVHAKAGHFNTLVWVTDLETGQAVADASVSVYKDALTDLDPVPADAFVATTDAGGIAFLPGVEELDPERATFRWDCREDDCEKLFIRVDGARGMAILPLNRDYRGNVARASNYEVYPSPRERYGHMYSWGTTAQGVYRAGDTMEFKVYVRNQSNEQFVPAPRSGYTLSLIDPTGKMVHEVEGLELNEFGAVAGEYRIPENAVMGWYTFGLSAGFTEHQWSPMRVLVSDFTPASFRVSTDLNGDLFAPGDQLVVDTRAALHSGGAYTQAEARVSVNLRARPFRSSHPIASTFRFDTSIRRNRVQLYQDVGELSSEGAYETRLELAESGIVYGNLAVESAVRDDRGKYVAAAASAEFVAVDRLVGLRKASWVFDEDKPADVEYLVVNERGEPVADSTVKLAIERLERKAARVKGAGNAYTTTYTETWESAGACNGTPAGEPSVCTFTPADPGSYRIVASIEDTRGRSHSSTLHAWVVGKGRVIWREEASNALELVPEAAEYAIGDTARVLVKNPFPGATALVTLERYGVLKQWQTTLEGSTPVIDFPIEAELVPGAYLSVVVVSPRVAAPPAANADGGAEVDLGKPAFRMGYLEIPIVDPYKVIDVTATADKPVYRPGERVHVDLAASPAHPGTAAEPIEYAVVVLDEAVLDLIADGRRYFDPYAGFNSLDGLDVENFSLLLRMVGRQKFEKKGASAGGDGGEGLSMRSLFKYVAYWNPSIRADGDGRASVDFELPDNLTGWRVLALAVTPTDRFGLGDGRFRSNQPTEIRPVMPNQVMEGDGFSAGFSVMNRTDQPRTLTVELTAEGDVDAGGAELVREIELKPFERQTVYLPAVASRLRASRDVGEGAIRFTARAGDVSDTDGLTHELPVLKRRQLEVAASYGSLTEGAVSEPIVLPDDAYRDTGAVSVVLAPTVIGNAEGAFRYMRDYPYTCWEQKLTRGVMASHFTALEGRLDPTLEWPEAADLPADMLAQAANFQAPNGGMTYYVPVDQNVSPYLSAYTALAFNWLRHAGHAVPTTVEDRLHEYLLRLLRRDEVPDFYSRHMSSTVRAVALNALAEHGKVTLADLRRYSGQLQYMDLFGAANFMDAALQFDGAGDLVDDAVAHVQARSNTTGGKLTFNDDIDDGFDRILTTPLRSNCAVLSAFSRVTDLARYGLDAVPTAMTRAITQTRGSRDHWENTQENMFCLNAFLDYSRAFEQETPDMKITVALGEAELGMGRFVDFRDEALTFEAPITETVPGPSTTVGIAREGTGRLYHATRLVYAPITEPTERVNAGMSVRREYSVRRDGEWVLLERPAVVKRGELVRVDLFLDLPSARNFVVVDDPVAGGLEPVNRALANASGLDADSGDYPAAGGSFWYSFGDWNAYGFSRWSFYHRETRHDAVRFYSDYLRPGRYHLSYSAQAIATGTFGVRPTHAAEMYDPDVYGKSLPGALEVQAR